MIILKAIRIKSVTRLIISHTREFMIMIAIIGSTIIVASIHAQENQAILLLDLTKARAAYEIAKQKLEDDERLYINKAISEDEYNLSKNELLSREVDYQKLLLRLISEQSYIIVEKAIKYQNSTGEKRVKIILWNTMEGNREYLYQFKEHFDVFNPEMMSGKIYNIFVSIVNLEDQTIIGAPYEIKIPDLESGKTYEVDFNLLRDIESLQVVLSYNGRKDYKNIYLEKDASANIVDINSYQFSQEADLGSQASFDLLFERFSITDDVYKLAVLNLPQQISYDFIDTETGARLSQLKFTQGVNIKTLVLRTYLPNRVDENVVIDKPIDFYALVLTRAEYEKLGDISSKNFTERDLNSIQSGRVRLELIPRGVGRIEVRAPSLYYEITAEDSVSMDITIRNIGTRRLDNIKVSIDTPFRWQSIVHPDLIALLEPDEEANVYIAIIPPSDAGIGAQEIRIKTDALADNRQVETYDKTVRIQVNAKTPILGTSILIILLIGLVFGTVIYGIKISRR
ncbi:NEW3 domain-containing protein [Candidatus Neomarinimicrobiota bacterium]